MTADSWEGRMAERAHQRAAVAEPPPATFPDPRPELPWLGGWPRIGRGAVLIGTGVHCVCCGRLAGVTTVAFPSNWTEIVESRSDPTWPFDESDCPICIGSDD
jgi:hypothetical protein